MIKNFLIIGGAGEVGRGIVSAIKENGDYRCNVVDPKINRSFDEFDAKELLDLFSNTDIIIYSADIGNRDMYEIDSTLSDINISRFNHFVLTTKKYNNFIPIWYIGGSWTKRKPNNQWHIEESSYNKAPEECNAYEKAKVASEKNAQKLANDEQIHIRFIDYISIVPNLSPNFSIVKMTEEALSLGTVHFSAGDFGRPLLDSTSAGRILLKLISQDINKDYFRKYLIPGIFIPFSEFAQIVKTNVEKYTKKEVRLIPIDQTPLFLSTRITSSLINSENFELLKKKLYLALDINIIEALKNHVGKTS